MDVLYEAADRFLNDAQTTSDVKLRATRLARVQAIITELRGTLQHHVDADLAGQLDAIYLFLIERLKSGTPDEVALVRGTLDDMSAAANHAIHMGE